MPNSLKLLYLIIFNLYCVIGIAQTTNPSTSVTNEISNSEFLFPFFKKLQQLENGSLQKVNIVHIGDSHIQADFFSGKIRKQLQEKFGNAGRGLIFPYKVAESNEPEDYSSNANNAWQWRRSVKVDNPLPIGISGYTLFTDKDSAWLSIKVNNSTDAFDKITIFHNKDKNCFDFIITNQYNKIIGYIPSHVQLMPYTSTIIFHEKQQHIVIRCQRSSVEQQHAYIYGIALENNNKGIIYNTIAANGAAFYHFNCAQYFARQLPFLKADLIIVSLGTNEALHPPFAKKLFWNQMELFIKRITQNNKDVVLLFTTPPDSYLQKHTKNKYAEDVTETLIHYCKINDIAYYDLYNIMGGLGAMEKWEKQNMVQPDRIHYTYKGYITQANMFIEAFFNRYQKFINP